MVMTVTPEANCAIALRNASLPVVAVLALTMAGATEGGNLRASRTAAEGSRAYLI